jgi:hypothetical protein
VGGGDLSVLMGFNGALPFFMVSPGVFTFAFTFASQAVSGSFRGSLRKWRRIEKGRALSDF